MLNVIMPSVVYAECNYAKCCYAECNYANCCYVECNYAKCCYAVCRGAFQRAPRLLGKNILPTDISLTQCMICTLL